MVINDRWISDYFFFPREDKEKQGIQLKDQGWRSDKNETKGPLRKVIQGEIN